MIRELKRLINDKFLIPVWTVFILLICIWPIVFINSASYTSRNQTYCIRYNNQEELALIIENYQTEYDRAITLDAKNKVKKELDFYNYLYESKIAYKDFRVDQELTMNMTKISFLRFVIPLLSITLFSIISLTNIKIFNFDVSAKTYKYLYNDYKDSFKLYLNKVLTSIVISALYLLLSIALISIIGLSLTNSFKEVIFRYNEIFTISCSKLLLNIYLLFIVQFITYEILSLAISTLYLSSIITFIINLAVAVIMYAANGVKQLAIFNYSLDITKYGYNIQSIYLIALVYFVACAFLLAMSIVYIKNFKFKNNIKYVNV